MIERATKYIIPKEDVRAMQFCYLCSFGLKEPIFTEEHLSLCDDNILLILRTEEEEIPLFLHKSRKGKFHISMQVYSTFQIDQF